MKDNDLEMPQGKGFVHRTKTPMEIVRIDHGEMLGVPADLIKSGISCQALGGLLKMQMDAVQSLDDPPYPDIVKELTELRFIYHEPTILFTHPATAGDHALAAESLSKWMNGGEA